MVVLAALATLPPKGRAVVVLRYWADLSVDQVVPRPIRNRQAQVTGPRLA